MIVRPRPQHLLQVALALTVAVTAGCATSAPATAPGGTPSATPSPSPLLSTDPGTSRVAELAPDFPSDLLPVPAGATVLVSAATPTTGTMWDVSLNVRTEQDVAGLVEAVRGPLVAAGFTEHPVTPAAGLAAQTSFSRGDGELVVVAVQDVDGLRTLTAGGTVSRPAG